MSRRPDFTSNYSNGYDNDYSGYDDSFQSTTNRSGLASSGSLLPAFRPRERRAGQVGGAQVGGPGSFGAMFGGSGTGGFVTSSSRENTDEESAIIARPTSLERTSAKRRSGGNTWSRRGGMGGGEGNRQIEEVLQHIKQDWDFMMDDKCVPVQVALQLMDGSSLGLAVRYRRFQDIHQQLQNALRSIVNEHHQGFNSSIGTYHNIQAAIQSSQQRLRTLRDSLGQAKGSLATIKPDLKGLATSSQMYDDMLMTLLAM